jgi:hypothetical protein
MIMVLKSNHIIIECEGGIVAAVWSSDPDMDVTIIDHDILEDSDPEPAEMERYEEAVTELQELRDGEDVEQVF